MISWTDVNELQKQKIDLQLKLDELLKSGNASQDNINEIKAEILHLEKNINRILGSNEVRRQKELKSAQSGIDEKNKKRYYSFKKKYDKISKLNEATSHILAVIDRMQNQPVTTESYVKVLEGARI